MSPPLPALCPPTPALVAPCRKHPRAKTFVKRAQHVLKKIIAISMLCVFCTKHTHMTNRFAQNDPSALALAPCPTRPSAPACPHFRAGPWFAARYCAVLRTNNFYDKIIFSECYKFYAQYSRPPRTARHTPPRAVWQGHDGKGRTRHNTRGKATGKPSGGHAHSGGMVRGPAALCPRAAAGVLCMVYSTWCILRGAARLARHTWPGTLGPARLVRPGVLRVVDGIKKAPWKISTGLFLGACARVIPARKAISE